MLAEWLLKMAKDAPLGEHRILRLGRAKPPGKEELARELAEKFAVPVVVWDAGPEMPDLSFVLSGSVLHVKVCEEGGEALILASVSQRLGDEKTAPGYFLDRVVRAWPKGAYKVVKPRGA